MAEKISFSFGQNWKSYLDGFFNKKRYGIAEKSITDFLGIKDLKGKTFMDIGCGSGIFSLCALKLGAKKVISFDVDPHSVACAKYLRSKEKNPKKWDVHHGSVLDSTFLKKLPQVDIVYSWGVLHHTGKMWQAIDNASKKVKPGGLFYFAIYNKKVGFRGSRQQLQLKRVYNRSPKPVKKMLEYSVVGSFMFKNLVTLKNPFRLIREKEKSGVNRGMSFWVDVTDWLGGLPYEYARPQEIFDFMTKKHDFQLLNIYMVDERNLLGNNQYLFKRA